MGARRSLQAMAAVAFAVALLAGGLVPAPTASAAPPLRPNIVMILVDDLGAVDDRLWSRLPTIQRTFIDRGWQFTDFHVETPLCCPGRAGFLTGQHTHNHGVVTNDGRLYDSSMSVAVGLDGLGYRTFFVGKFMNQWAHMEKRQPGWDEIHGSGGGYFDHAIWHDSRNATHYGQDEDDYSTDVYARTAVQAMRRADANEPIFAVVAPFAPHEPLIPAPRHADGCNGIPRWSPPNYNEQDMSDKPAHARQLPLMAAEGFDLLGICRLMLGVDDLVKTIKGELRAQGRLRDTLLIFTADNGMAYGSHRYPSKVNPYSTRVPFFASWPAHWENQPRSPKALLSNIDLGPTLCGLAGCELGPYASGHERPDGRSFGRLLRGGKAPQRGAILHSWLIDSFMPRWTSIRTSRHWPDGRWHYIEHSTGERELYDLARDPWEMDSVHDQAAYAVIQTRLAERLAQLREE